MHGRRGLRRSAARQDDAMFGLTELGVVEVYAGAPHGITDRHRAELNADPLAFLRAK